MKTAKTRLILSIIIYLLLFGGVLLSVYARRIQNPQEPPPPQTREGFALNTFVSVTIYGGANEAALDAAFALIYDYELVFSRTNPKAELYALNLAQTKGGAAEKTKISPALYETIKTALYYCERSGGLFDITIAPLVDLWDFQGENGGTVPAPLDIAAALERVDYRKIELLPDYYIRLNGAQIDLGAAAKGYIADRAADKLREYGVSSAVIDLGGNIYVLGGKPATSYGGSGGALPVPFKIGIQKPFETSLAAVIDARDTAVVTSGVYQRYFETGGRLYHHILNPHTGSPSDNGLHSATIIAPSALDADILSTVCMLLPQDTAARIIREEGVSAVFIDKKDEITEVNGGVYLNFQIID